MNLIIRKSPCKGIVNKFYVTYENSLEILFESILITDCKSYVYNIAGNRICPSSEDFRYESQGDSDEYIAIGAKYDFSREDGIVNYE